MIRRKLQEWLPCPETLRNSRWLRWCAPILGHPRLWNLHRKSVALGVSIGLVTGLIPGPVQMLLAALIAIPLRANIPAAVFTTLYTNPFTFIPLYILAYNIGRLFTGADERMELPKDIEWSIAGLKLYLPELASWIASLGDTLLIGLAIQFTIFAIVGYVAVMVGWRIAVTTAWRRRCRKRALRAA